MFIISTLLTTKEFLRRFGMDSLEQLPEMKTDNQQIPEGNQQENKEGNLSSKKY